MLSKVCLYIKQLNTAFFIEYCQGRIKKYSVDCGSRLTKRINIEYYRIV